MRILPLFVLLLALSVSAEPRKPNVIVIMADDLGFGDISCQGATTYETPNIDRLAAEGIRFTSGYCTASTCTPTRFSLLTGGYAFRTKGTGIAPPSAPAIILPGDATLPGMMQSAGYATAVIGKWHLGLGGVEGPDWNAEISPGPLDIGFDHCFLLPTTNDRVPQVYLQDRRVLNLDPSDPIRVYQKKPSEDHPTGITHRDSLKMDWTHGHNHTIHNGISRIGFYTGGEKARFRDEDLADEWVKRSVAWMESKKEAPFFLFYAAHEPHVPRMPHERFQGKTPHGYRTDSILELDWCVGEILAALDRLGIAENTLVVFCSDNGPVMDDGYADGALEKVGDHRAAGPFKGGKYSVYEGGTRTPFLARWKGAIAPGVSDEIVATIDLYSSLAALTGTAVPEGAARDSENVLGALLGEPGAKGRTELVQQDNGSSGNFGFRSGKWKLVRHDKGKARNVVVEKLLETTDVPRLQLFDLAADPGETRDLSAKEPERLNAMAKRLEEIVASE
ncbi:MAG: arylsulfatase [Verrucomicrobiales bacterium]|nr:arylsulfatase [Verrucomicrobiales bacterium]